MLPVDTVLVFRFSMPPVIVDMQVQAGRGQRSMTQIVTNEPKINLLIGHVRAGAVTQPVGGSFLR